MTPADLLAWRQHMGYTQHQAAQALGITPSAYQALERGRSYVTGKPMAIDRRTALACGAIAAGVGEFISKTA